MVASLTDDSREMGKAIWGQSSEAKERNQGTILLSAEAIFLEDER